MSWRSTKRSTTWLRIDPRQAEIVEMRYFGGLTEAEVATVKALSPATIRQGNRGGPVLAGTAHEDATMNPSAWERAKALLADAATLPAADRERFVIEHCSDPELRREVLELLDSPAPLLASSPHTRCSQARALGPYVDRSVDRQRRHGRSRTKPATAR